jgi:cellulose synthase/poly-beta-1,6-N-acetylglucosamine synthase-like glycosyltransferase
MARGEFVALLDHDDLLAPFALYEVVQSLNGDPRLDLVYSDRDVVDVTGRRRFGPLFKPQWSPSTLFSASYLTHLSVIRRELVERVGGFRPDTDGAQDWDLFLRVTQHTHRVAHVPKVLYHWRTAPASVTRGIETKPYALKAQLRAMADALVARGVPAEATRSASGRIRFRWSPTQLPRVSVVVRPFDGVSPDRASVESVLSKTAYPNLELVWFRPMASPAAVGGELENGESDSRVVALPYPGSGAPPAAWNWAATKAGGEVLVFLNAELGVLEPDWLQQMVGVLRDDVGLVGAKVLGADGTIHQAGVVIPRPHRALHLFSGAEEADSGLFGPSDWYRDLLAVCECLMIRRQLFEALGGYDERWRSCAADAELCLRARRAGWRVVYTPFARLAQRLPCAPGPSTGPSFEIPFRHHDDLLKDGDPYFGPSLLSAEPIPTLDLRDRGKQSPDPSISD